MSGSFEGKVIIVTGAGSGIGQRAAERFAEEGGVVICVDRDFERLSSSLRDLANSGAVHGIEADITDASNMKAVASQALRIGGRIDVLFANAGVASFGTAIHTTETEWDEAIRINLTGTWLSANAVLPTMCEQRAGAIVCQASVAGLVGMRAVAAYSAAKAGVIGLTRQMAADYARMGIRVNAICPGITETPMLQRMLDMVGEAASTNKTPADRLEAFVRPYPLGRLGSVDDIAEAVLFLASEKASWLTGVIFPVDGGYSAV